MRPERSASAGARGLRWRKMLREAWLDKARTLLVACALVVGLAAAGALVDTQALIARVTRETFEASNPVSATLQLDRVDAALLERVRALPEISAVRARRVVGAAIQAGGVARHAQIFVLDDFTRTSIGALHAEVGVWPPRDGELAIERSALAFSGASLNEPLPVVVGGATHALPLTGIVRDVGLAPGWMDNVVYLFATPATLERLGIAGGFDELQLRVRDAAADRDGVRRIAARVRAIAESAGAQVRGIDVPVPGEHMHAAQMNSLMMTQLAFGALTLLVCAFLVVNLVNAMLARQLREIGIMRTLGGSNGAIAAIYLSHALLIGVVASLVAVPIALAIGRAYAGFKSEMLNFPLDGVATPAPVVALQFLAGCLLPVVAAAWPVWRGCRVPVATALRDVGIDASVARRRIGALPGIGRPLLLSLNNAFRRRGRLALTLAALAAGGAVYLGAANLRNAVAASVDELFAAMKFDFALRLDGARPPAELEALAAASPGISGAEACLTRTATRVMDAGLEGEALRVVGLPPRGAMVEPRITAGRWLADGDAREIVVSAGALRDDPSLFLNRTVTLRMDGRSDEWRIVGVVASGPERGAYVARDTLARTIGDTRANSLVVATSARGLATQLDAIRALRATLEASGAPVAASQRIAEARKAFADHLTMAVEFLGAMGWVMVLVGGVGLASTMGLSVLERTRELGVLRAIGARHRDVLWLVEAEGVVIGLLAWLCAIPLALPIGALVGDAFGRMMFPVTTHLLPDAGATLRWLALVIAIALVASLWPALRALRVPTVKALGYE